MNNTALKRTIGIVLFFVVLFLIDRLVIKFASLNARDSVFKNSDSYFGTNHQGNNNKKLIPTGLFQQRIVRVGGKPKTKDKLICNVKKKKRKLTSK